MDGVFPSFPLINSQMAVAFSRLNQKPLDGWGAARYQDAMLAMQWLWDHQSNSTTQPLLWDVMELLIKQGQDWKSWFNRDSTTFAKGCVPKTVVSVVCHFR